MFYDALKANHGLPHDPIDALVSPRPIGWISTLSKAGVPNLAPYSFFNLVAKHPAVVMFSSGFSKDTQQNIEDTGEFVCNIASWELREQMNQTSAHLSPEINEFEVAGLEPEASTLVRPPRVKRALAALECRYDKTVTLPTNTDKPHFFSMVIGMVVGVYVNDEVVHDGIVDVTRIRPLSRLGYMDYAVVNEIFQMQRPKGDNPGLLMEKMKAYQARTF